MSSAVCLVLLAVTGASAVLAKQTLTLDEQERGLTNKGVGVGAVAWGARVQERDKKQAGLPLTGSAASVVRYPTTPTSSAFAGQAGTQQQQQQQQQQQLQQLQQLQQQGTAGFSSVGQASPTGVGGGLPQQQQAYGPAFPSSSPSYQSFNGGGVAAYPGSAGAGTGGTYSSNGQQQQQQQQQQQPLYYPGNQGYPAQQAYPVGGYPSSAYAQPAFSNVGAGGGHGGALVPTFHAAPAFGGPYAAPAHFFPGAVTTHGVYPVAYGTYTSVYHPPATASAGPTVVHAAAPAGALPALASYPGLGSGLVYAGQAGAGPVYPVRQPVQPVQQGGATGAAGPGYSYQSVRGYSNYPAYPTGPGTVHGLQQQQQQQQQQLLPLQQGPSTPTFQPSSFGVTQGAQALLSQALVQAGAAPKDPPRTQQRSDDEQDGDEDVQDESLL